MSRQPSSPLQLWLVAGDELLLGALLDVGGGVLVLLGVDGLDELVGGAGLLVGACRTRCFVTGGWARCFGATVTTSVVTLVDGLGEGCTFSW